MFQIKILVNVQNISQDSVICEKRMTRQIHHVEIRQDLQVIRLLKLNLNWLFLRHTFSSGPPEQVWKKKSKLTL